MPTSLAQFCVTCVLPIATHATNIRRTTYSREIVFGIFFYWKPRIVFLKYFYWRDLNKMTDNVKFLVGEINRALKTDYNLITFDALSVENLLQVFVDVLQSVGASAKVYIF